MPVLTLRGHSIHYRHLGSGPPLLLLPGQTASSASFAADLRKLSTEFTVIAPDFLGTGLSQRVRAFGLSYWDEAARDMVALIRALGLERFGIVGCSGGGVVAIILGAGLGERVAALVLDSTPEWASEGDLKRILEHRQRHWDDFAPFWEKAHGDDWERVVRLDTGFLEELANHGGLHLGTWLASLRCPCLFFASLRDTVLPRAPDDAHRMAAQVPGSRCILVNEGDHPVMWSCPQVFHHAAGAFLREHLGSPLGI